MIITGKYMPFLFLIMTYLVFYLSVSRAKKGKVPAIRIIPAVEALVEGVGRSTEMGRPVHFTTGWGGKLTSKAGPYHMAGINLLDTIATETSQKGAELIVTVGHTESLPIIQDTVRDAYMRSGKLEDYRPEMVEFTAPYQMAYATSVLRVLERERPAASYLLGAFSAEVMILAEGGNRVGAFSIGGSVASSVLPFLIATCDYVFIGEELLIAGSVAVKDDTSIGGIVGADVPKIICMGIIVIGTILATIGYDWTWLLRL